VNVQNGEAHGKIFAPILIVEYDELNYQNLLDNMDVTIDYKVTFILKNSDINYNVQVRNVYVEYCDNIADTVCISLLNSGKTLFR